MSVYELAKRYYPRLWDRSRIETLVQAWKLTREEADEIMGVHTESITDEKEA